MLREGVTGARLFHCGSGKKWGTDRFRRTERKEGKLTPPKVSSDQGGSRKKKKGKIANSRGSNVGGEGGGNPVAKWGTLCIP